MVESTLKIKGLKENYLVLAIFFLIKFITFCKKNTLSCMLTSFLEK